jgi:enoyl-[acyl-carrier protein] reductase I
MSAEALSFSLKGKRGLVIGIANDQSIAWGCAQAFAAAGATLACTYLNEKAEKFVRPLAEKVGSEIIVKCDVQKV